MDSKLYGVDATIIIFVFVLYCMELGGGGGLKGFGVLGLYCWGAWVGLSHNCLGGIGVVRWVFICN